MTVANKPGHKSAKETVKTIARGMPGVSGVTVVTNARVKRRISRVPTISVPIKMVGTLTLLP
jgi:hypothetical protein